MFFPKVEMVSARQVGITAPVLRRSGTFFGQFGNLCYIRRRLDSLAFIAQGPFEYFTPMANTWSRWEDIIRWRECSKKFVQQGRSHFDARSVLSVREHEGPGTWRPAYAKPLRQAWNRWLVSRSFSEG